VKQNVKAKAKRERLFKRSKPFFRPFTDNDLGILWAAYKKGGFKLPEDLKEQDFLDLWKQIEVGWNYTVIGEDDCKAYKSGRGPVCMIAARTDGWKHEPHIEWFPWASTRNILRGSVAYLHKTRYDKQVGVCLMRSLEETRHLFERLEQYGVAFPVGKVPFGDARGDEYLFYVKGNKTQ
jgi:hypothetical protein